MKAVSAAPQSPLAFLAVALAFAINMMGTTLPTAIYRYYQQQYGFTPTVITVIYASYAIGVLGALLLIGNWSDQLGRRRMLLAGLCVSAASALTFVFSDGLALLMLGRLLSGISAGIFTGTATVAVIELAPPAWRGKATFAATASNMLGLGFGPLLSGILVELFPRPMQFPYMVHLALIVIAAIAVFRVPETAAIPARVKLGVQKLSLPAEVRAAFILAALAGFAGFVVVGFFAAVAPQLMRVVLGLHSGIVIGSIVFLLFACSALGQIVQTLIAARWRQATGCIGLVLGLVWVGLCVPERSLGALLLGTVVAGIGQGISFRAGLGEIASAAPAHRRAEVTSSFFVVLYVAISLPVIGLGIAVQFAGIERATLLFAGLTIALVLIALLLLMLGQMNRKPGAAPIGD
ncbi:MFS transporter [Caballeronia ptereochthonis]|uniref:EmrB/QacA family drug resistance transporter n=1 Tax=Caballeronia ptereochthonis TaxID=1777144 RepID=A0A158ASX7_9BURK|nr:MFS transporter [Caballeronia ptereochthonis]SAK61048.1 EmrB/QacA family drug resistance transporter [Caballeronia ptereochthonis]